MTNFLAFCEVCAFIAVGMVLTFHLGRLHERTQFLVRRGRWMDQETYPCDACDQPATHLVYRPPLEVERVPLFLCANCAAHPEQATMSVAAVRYLLELEAAPLGAPVDVSQN